MATKRYNQESFEANVNGRNYTFYAYTTNTRHGFCHTIQTLCEGSWLSDTKVSYWNQTWERFRYESALSRAIDKCLKRDQEQLREIIIERKAKKEQEECEKFINRFEAMHNALSDENKERLKEVTGGHLGSEAEAHAAYATGLLMLALQ